MLKIFNTLTCKKEIFKPIEQNKINLYVCGVTVYDFCHIGHGRTFIVFDMIVRYFKYLHFQVTYVRNITDIDDKIIEKSIKENININILTKNMIHAMNKDFSMLNLIIPDEEPRITDYRKDIIELITELLDKKYAYINEDGDVVFSIDKDINYGSLSHQSLDLLKSGSRIPINKMKKNPLDFILWKKEKDKEKEIHFSWDSPWGQGRPGWHIECSTMIKTFFNNSVDIHGGGSDLLFPHHENEKSQSSVLDKELKINVWMHTGMVIINNKKMSKSLNNVYFLKDILASYDAETIRYFLLSTHYRRPIHYSSVYLDQSRSALETLYIALYGTHPISNLSEGRKYEMDFKNAMNDDFNTPKAFSTFFQLAHEINSFKSVNKLQANLLAFRLLSLANSIGFLLQKPENFLKKICLFNIDKLKKIQELIEQRNIARQSHLWEKADKIRDELISWGIFLEDFPTYTLWRKK
ncbi:cysteine--tRNA ligase [Buchnera aphidicola]|uniref:cysteine--tRNA ligase n=1 Tax=Buchnera aphidicola TaxID=9 RepID=UPI003BEEFF78